jgi:hypothetical protein
VTGGVNRWGFTLTKVAAALGAIVAAGCSAPGTALESSPEVVRSSVGAILHDPVWSYRMHALVGLTDDHQLAKITDPDSRENSKTQLSASLGAGRNIQISQKDDRHVFVPQPESGRVAVVDLAAMRQIDDFDAGPAPAFLAEDAGMRVLLALSADGSSVTAVDEYGDRKLLIAKMIGDRADTIGGANRGREIDYHLYGPSGIRYFKGSSSPPEERGALPMDVGAWAGDGMQVTRSYVASPNGDVLYAVDSRRGGQGLQVLASTRLPSPIRAVATDSTRIYAVTDREVVVLQTASFTGFPAKTIPVIRVVNYRRGASDSEPVSGMAVGPHRVYLSLAGTPRVVSVAKPKL